METGDFFCTYVQTNNMNKSPNLYLITLQRDEEHSNKLNENFDFAKAEVTLWICSHMFLNKNVDDN